MKQFSLVTVFLFSVSFLLQASDPTNRVVSVNREIFFSRNILVTATPFERDFMVAQLGGEEIARQAFLEESGPATYASVVSTIRSYEQSRMEAQYSPNVIEDQIIVTGSRIRIARQPLNLFSSQLMNLMNPSFQDQ